MPRHLLCLSLALLLAACVVGDAEPDDAALQAPTFDPEPDDATDPVGDAPPPDEEAAEAADPDPDEPDEPPPDANDSAELVNGDSAESVDGDSAESPTPEGGQQEQPRDPAPDTEEQPEPILHSRITDPQGDTESARLTSGPDYADLVGGLLERYPRDGYRLAIELDGGAPEQARDGDHTMNIATFYDITGDGHIDVEVWANLADGGWDTAWFDNREGRAAFSDDDEISVAVVDDALVLSFPLDTLEGATSFRWAVASEWGRYEQLGTPLSVRDEMPDDGAPAPFPG